jgi:hypothetical protein
MLCVDASLPQRPTIGASVPRKWRVANPSILPCSPFVFRPTRVLHGCYVTPLYYRDTAIH